MKRNLFFSIIEIREPVAQFGFPEGSFPGVACIPNESIFNYVRNCELRTANCELFGQGLNQDLCKFSILALLQQSFSRMMTLMPSVEKFLPQI